MLLRVNTYAPKPLIFPSGRLPVAPVLVRSLRYWPLFCVRLLDRKYSLGQYRGALLRCQVLGLVIPCSIVRGIGGVYFLAICEGEKVHPVRL